MGRGSCSRKEANIGVVNLLRRPDARQRAIGKTTAEKRRMRSPGRSARLGGLPCRWCRFCADGERCVCSPPYYFLGSTYHLEARGAGGGWAVSPAGRRHMETDMKDCGRRAGGEAPQFGPGGLRSVFSELGAVVAATVVLGLAFVMLS